MKVIEDPVVNVVSGEQDMSPVKQIENRVPIKYFPNNCHHCKNASLEQCLQKKEANQWLYEHRKCQEQKLCDMGHMRGQNQISQCHCEKHKRPEKESNNDYVAESLDYLFPTCI